MHAWHHTTNSFSHPNSAYAATLTCKMAHAAHSLIHSQKEGCANNCADTKSQSPPRVADSPATPQQSARNCQSHPLLPTSIETARSEHRCSTSGELSWHPIIIHRWIDGKLGVLGSSVQYMFAALARTGPKQNPIQSYFWGKYLYKYLCALSKRMKSGSIFMVAGPVSPHATTNVATYECGRQWASGTQTACKNPPCD